ncbi:MAG: histidine kinase [Euryarchaeota archaeon]|jgi:hypothetical protein|nr:histidine kinase [Euryarchaeota archaeon]MDP6659029.1 PEP/pyruvate-binding domain-containing protein [Candidatus Poseidoniia archaeon]MDP6846820.1 PEP/pyruvate-binding domain-containing protein [Candidatus Poseidoniia archaeon]MDP7007048.1 PEP/pyruvate-binding domain-containing protein [Candidatus Poseidoniia archaeon]
MATWGSQHRRFENLMRYRIRDILLVSSPYDYFTLEEDGRLNELLLVDYQQLNLSYAPRITHAATGERALDLLKERPFDLVITMARVGEMAVHVFGRRTKEIQPGIPVVLLAYNTRELALFHEGDAIDRIFVWSGDARVLLAIIKLVEDLRNVDHDTRSGEVQVLILVEDSPRFYSLFLPQLYAELMKQTGSLMAGGLSLHHKLLRMRARAKILLATDMEQAQELHSRYAPFLLGVISDAGFPSEGSHDPQAGKKFVAQVQRESPDAAVMLQSSLPENRKVAAKLGVEFIDKADQSLLKGLRSFMRQSLGFGDFVFRLPDGKEVGRAQDITEMRKLLPDVPGESLRHHAARHGFSKWFRARTEFDLAASLRPHVVTEFTDNEQLRQFLLDALRAFEKQRRQAEVADYSSQALEAGSNFVRLGGGSLGGKGRSLAYFHALLPRLDLAEFGDIEVSIPRTAVVGTKVFDEFLESNELGELAYSDTSELDDDALAEAFLEARFPESIYDDLKTFVGQVEYPLAVRSSSLLEDSQHQPFAGVYETYMLSNNHPDQKQRLQHLCDAIKLVYASTFYRASKAYIAATPNRIEEEKMAVVIQEVVGLPHGDAYYPTFAGVARSRNFYPLGDAAPEDGVVAVALGLGKAVVEGEKMFRFSPAHPRQQFQFASTEDYLRSSQRQFWALDLSKQQERPTRAAEASLVQLDLSRAEMDRQLHPIGSVYSAENHAIYDGLARAGVRLVTFAGVTKQAQFPLSGLTQLFLEQAEQGMGGPVEIEFAAIIAPGVRRYAFLQARPLVWEPLDVEVDLESVEGALCTPSQALGNGVIEELRDIVYIHPDRLDRAETRAAAKAVEKLNRKLARAGRPYLLIGPGRWGSSDPWLGIPVNWAQISGARTIIECQLADLPVEPSQGTHFFQNIVSFSVGYLTAPRGGIDWKWLEAQKPAAKDGAVRHLKLKQPLQVLLDGRAGRGAVLPGRD